MTPACRTLRIPFARPSALAGGVAMVMLAGLAQAQDAAAVDGPRPSVWVEPRVSAGVTLSSNGNLSSTQPRSEQVLEFGPGVRAVMNTPRIQGFADYSLHGRLYTQDTSGDDLRHALRASATLNAWDNRAFVDVSGVVDDRSISAFGPPSGATLADINRTQTASFRVSPYLRGDLAGWANYELRYSLHTSDNDAANRSDVAVQDVSLRLDSRRTAQLLGWTLDASSQEVEYSLGRRTQSNSFSGGLVFAPTSQLLLTLRAGVESNNIITLQRESYNTHGGGVEWRPSPRTRLLASVDKRYFGTGHNIAFEHRTGRTVWRYTDSRNVVNNPLEAASASLGSIYDLFDSLYTTLEPDPVRRAQMVQAELLRLGLPADTQIFQSFLTSSSSLERAQRLSVALMGVRGVVTLALLRSNSSRLDPVIGLGDDFDANDRIWRQSWSLTYAHRLTPIMSYNVGLISERNRGSAGLSRRVTTVSTGLSTRLGPRTDGSLRLQRSNHRGSLNVYGETVIAGFVTHRF